MGPLEFLGKERKIYTSSLNALFLLQEYAKCHRAYHVANDLYGINQRNRLQKAIGLYKRFLV